MKDAIIELLFQYWLIVAAALFLPLWLNRRAERGQRRRGKRWNHE